MLPTQKRTGLILFDKNRPSDPQQKKDFTPVSGKKLICSGIKYDLEKTLKYRENVALVPNKFPTTCNQKQQK